MKFLSEGNSNYKCINELKTKKTLMTQSIRKAKGHLFFLFEIALLIKVKILFNISEKGILKWKHQFAIIFANEKFSYALVF